MTLEERRELHARHMRGMHGLLAVMPMMTGLAIFVGAGTALIMGGDTLRAGIAAIVGALAAYGGHKVRPRIAAYADRNPAVIMWGMIGAFAAYFAFSIIRGLLAHS